MNMDGYGDEKAKANGSLLSSAQLLLSQENTLDVWIVWGTLGRKRILAEALQV